MKKTIKGKVFSMILCYIALIFALPTAVSAQSGMSLEAEEHILNELRRAGIPNAAVAVIQGGETSYILKDSEHDTFFAIASVTKPFTAFGVLLLEDMGLLSIHDPVNQHLPWFEVVYNGVLVPHEDITIYNLITHTSGMAQNEDRFPRATPTETTDEFTARLVGMELDFYPSTSSAYSNMAYIILGLLIEAVSGQSYDDFMTQQVFHPLGLYDTFTSSERASATGRVVNGHMRGFLHAWQDDRDSDRHRNLINTPSGGMYSNVSDLVRWAEIQLGIVDVPEQFARVVRRSHTPNLDANVAFMRGYVFADGGWYINLENGRIEHAGGGRGYAAIVRLLPESNAAAVVLTNQRINNIDELADIALDAVVYGIFNNRSRDIGEMVDIGFTILCAVGVVYLGLLVRLIIKLRKRLRNGEIIKSDFSAKNIKALIYGPILSIAGLIFYYSFQFIILDTTRASLLLNWPISFAIAAVAVWIHTLYDVFAWWVKAAVNPK